jgi:hypothetical protein
MSSTSFLDLPAELRVMMYKHILASTVDPSDYHEPEAPTPIRLQEYCGLILASKKIKQEFEHEWIVAFNKWLKIRTESAGLQATFLPPNATMREARHLYFSYSFTSRPDHRDLLKLFTNLHSFTLRPHRAFPPEGNAANDETTLRNFFYFGKAESLRRIQDALWYCYDDAKRQSHDHTKGRHQHLLLAARSFLQPHN